MSSLHKAIRFRETISKLDHKEFDVFISKICQSHNKRNLFTTSLFHLLLYQSKQNNGDLADNINKTITNIIESRKNTKFKTVSPTNIVSKYKKTNNISFNICSSLISLISSYLNLSDFVNFSLTNRNIYISVSCTSTSLTTINRNMWIYRYKNNYGLSSYERENQMLNIKRFKMIKNVQIDASQIIDVQRKEQYPRCLHNLWQHLDELALKWVEFRNPLNATFVDTLHSFRFKHLKLFRINMHESISFNPLINFICDLNHCGFTKLSLYYVQQNRVIPLSADNYDRLKKTKNLLNALCLHQVSAPFNHDIISIIGEDLESLHLISDENNEILPITCGKIYSKLEELCVFNVHPECIRYILQHAERLKRLNVCASHDYDWRKIIDILIATLNHNMQLEYIAVEVMITTNELQLLMEGFVECLNRTSSERRERLKLRLNFDLDEAIVQFLISYLMELLSALQVNVNDFALIISASWNEGEFKELEEHIQDIKVQHDYNVMIGKEYVSREEAGQQCKIRHVTISNRQCSMCAFNEAWIMDCNNCQQFHHVLSNAYIS